MPSSLSLLSTLLALTCLSALGQSPFQRNIVQNPSFEESVGGAPAEWQVESGQADAQWTLAQGEGRSGDNALRVTNSTERSPHVFGRVFQEVSLDAGVTYTLSAYFRSDEPGEAWLGAGTDWGHRFHVPVCPQWTRVTGTFVAEGGRTPIMFISESPTSGILIDDVQLERGPEATPFVYLRPPGEGELRVDTLDLDIPDAGANLLPNSSFEMGEGVPDGWSFNPRNTDATLLLDHTRARTGVRSVRVTNSTPFGAHVYGMMASTQSIDVEPDTTYTLSASFLTADDTLFWIGGGPDWNVRLIAPPTEGRWARASTTFRTGKDQRQFDLVSVTESPTRGVWIDDVKLEPGSVATPYVPEDSLGDCNLEIDAPPEIAADTTITLHMWAWNAPGTGAARVTVTIGDGGPTAETTAPEGLSLIRIQYGLHDGFTSPLAIRASLATADGRELATTEDTLSIVAAREQAERLDALSDTTAALRARLTECTARGLDGAYPLGKITILEQFGAFVAEDLAHGEIIRARDQIDQMEELAARAADELDRLAEGSLPPVPRYRTSDITVRDGAFRAEVEWPDGRVEEGYPVIFTGYGHFGAVKRDIEVFPDYGVNIIQIEFGPSSVFPEQGVEDLSVVDEHIALLDRAAAANVTVNLLLSPHYLPDWVYKAYENAGGVDGGFIRFSVDSPDVRAIHERFLRLVIPRLAGHPGLHSFCLSNEPVYRNATTDPENRRKYTEWLQARYGDLEAVEAAHGAAYDSFSAVPDYYSQDPGDMIPQAAYDYMRFNDERFADWHRWMADIIHEYAPDALLHAKPMATAFSRTTLDHGTDHELFNGFSQVAGNDSWKYIAGMGVEYANGWQGQNMYFDLLHSVGGMPIFNSENHLIPDRFARPTPPNHVRNVLWQAAIHGEGASTTWVWERTFDARSDFAGSIMHRPACVDAHNRTGLDLLRLGREVNALQTAVGRVAIIYSRASLHYNPECERVLLRAYEALNFAGEKIEFITDRQLASGKAPTYAAIVAAGTTHLPASALEGLRDYQAGGGRIITVGPDALGRDDYGRSVAEPIEPDFAVDEAVPVELRDALTPILAALPGGRPVHVLDADTDQEAWGVECLSVEFEGRTLVNLTNYLTEPARVRLSEVGDGSLTDLINGGSAGDVIELEPLEVALLAIEWAAVTR